MEKQYVSVYIYDIYQELRCLFCTYMSVDGLYMVYTRMYMVYTCLYMVHPCSSHFIILKMQAFCQPQKPVQTTGYTMYIHCIYMYILCLYMYIACTSAPNIICMFHYGIFHCKLVCTAIYNANSSVQQF